MMCQAESSSDYWEEDEELEDVRQFADIVEAALALHVATTMGYNFSNLEDTRPAQTGWCTVCSGTRTGEGGAE